jgi:hypothetical protein
MCGISLVDMMKPQKGTFNWITDSMTRYLATDAYSILQKVPGAEEWIRTAEPPKGEGFMWWNHPMVHNLKNALHDGHSGASAAETLRIAQKMGYLGWDQWASVILQQQKEEETTN